MATGSGRHALLLAAAGYSVFAVDRDTGRLRAALAEAARRHVRVRVWAADLERSGLPPGQFDVVVCTRYLQRSLLPALGRAVRPGGLLLYETFTTGQCQYDRGPRSPDHLLRPGELRQSFAAWDVLEYEEVEAPDAVARLAARRPAAP